MKSTEHRKDVDKLISEIRKLNENSKWLIIDLNDYNEISKELEKLQLTLLRNIKPYIKEVYNKLEELQLTLLRNMKPYIKEVSSKLEEAISKM